MSDKAAAELIGTAILLFTIQVSVWENAALAPLAIGFILVAIVFAAG
jgi:glycerol uptake facilitator-like aquaporin